MNVIDRRYKTRTFVLNGLILSSALAIFCTGSSTLADTNTDLSARPLGILIVGAAVSPAPASTTIQPPSPASERPLGTLWFTGPPPPQQQPKSLAPLTYQGLPQPARTQAIGLPTNSLPIGDRSLGMLIDKRNRAAPTYATQPTMPPLGILLNSSPTPTPSGPTLAPPLENRSALGGTHQSTIYPVENATPERPLGTLLHQGYVPLIPQVFPSQKDTDPVAPTVPADASQKAIHLAADEMSMDRENRIITATGNIKVRFKNRTLAADKITYNQNTNVVSAWGNVVIIEPTGEKLFGDTMEISGDLKDAVIDNIGIILQDHSRIAALGARYTNGRITDMRNAVYSPCNLCKDNSSKPPLWQIKAVRVIHNKDQHVVEYYDAWIEIVGFPVMYAPYFRHSDPTIKRKSGLLFPTFGSSSDLGAVLQTPYFWNISPNEDATITPIITTNEGPILSVEYQNLLQRADLKIATSIKNNSDDGEFATEKGSLGVRGHIKAEGRLSIDPTWRLGFDLKRSSDDTYMKRFGFASGNSLDSKFFIEGFRNRNYFSASGITFQSLKENVDDDTVPHIFPMLDYSHVSRRDQFGGRNYIDANFLTLIRGKGTNMRRLSLHQKWARPFQGPLGDLYNVSSGLNANLYHVSNLSKANGKEYSGFEYRAVPYAALDWQMPFIKSTGKIIQTIEPVAKIIVSPYGGNPTNIPNEDSTELEFDETNLFSINRFSGLDKVEGGPRLSYGLKWDLYGDSDAKTRFFLGQSYRPKADDTFATGSGLEDNFSDIVGRAKISPNSYFNLQYRTRFSAIDFAPNRNEAELTFGVPAFNVNTNYISLEGQENSQFSGREEINFVVNSKFNRFWLGDLNMARNVATNEMQSIGLNLIYEDECLMFTTSIGRNFSKDRDIKPTDLIVFRLMLKTLGETQTLLKRSNRPR